MDINIDLSKLVVSKFDVVLDIIINNKYPELFELGGRSTTKSQTTASSILIGCLVNNASAVCLVKYKNGIENRLVNTFLRSLDIIDNLIYEESGVKNGFSKYFRLKRSPFELIILDGKGKPTGNAIKFTGCDEPGKLKSFGNAQMGGFRYLWFEEATDFSSWNEISSAITTLGRGGKRTVIVTYNPPRSTSNWINKESLLDKPGRFYHHSTCEDVIYERPEWIGEDTINDILWYKENNTEFYRHEFLGEVIGTDGNVFNNVKELSDEEFNRTEINRGLDFGFTKDPTAYVEWAYDPVNKSIYCVAEYVAKGVDNETIAYNVKQLNKHNFTVWSDSEDPRTINELVKLGLKCVGVRKGPDSVRHGIKWLQSLRGIYINPVTCPNTYREFKNFEYKINKYGEFTGEYDDKDNHTIDATRYALVNKIN